MTEFQYSDAPQRSPEWYKLRQGKVTASRLSDWLAVSRAKGKEGTPLKARTDYEKELMYERQFGVSYNFYVSDAMQDGIDFENFAVKQYEQATGNETRECGAWYNDAFCASPDRVVVEGDGLLEVKIVRDNTFTDILLDGVPDKHQKQIQGQLWASGKKWCDYIAMNLNTKKFIIIRVEADQFEQDYLAEAVTEQLVVDEFDITELHDIKGELPQGLLMPAIAADHSDNVTKPAW